MSLLEKIDIISFWTDTLWIFTSLLTITSSVESKESRKQEFFQCNTLEEESVCARKFCVFAVLTPIAKVYSRKMHNFSQNFLLQTISSSIVNNLEKA